MIYYVVRIYHEGGVAVNLYKKLTPDQEIPFRKWARENYKPFESILEIWHPVVQAECVRMNAEAGQDFKIEVEETP